MDPAHRALDRLRDGSDRLAAHADRHGLDLVVVFGSVLTANPAGDVDVAVLSRRDLDPVAILDDLGAEFGPAEFDLLDLRRASPLARAEALGGGQPLFEREPGLFARWSTAALVAKMDTQWLRDLNREMLAR